MANLKPGADVFTIVGNDVGALKQVVKKLAAALNVKDEGIGVLTGESATRIPGSHAHIWEGMSAEEKLDFIIGNHVTPVAEVKTQLIEAQLAEQQAWNKQVAQVAVKKPTSIDWSRGL